MFLVVLTFNEDEEETAAAARFHHMIDDDAAKGTEKIEQPRKEGRSTELSSVLCVW